jgi:hypothetical protein
MILHKITEFYTECYGVCSNITSEFRTISLLKNFVIQNNDSNKTDKYVHNPFFFFVLPAFICVCVKVHELSP